MSLNIRPVKVSRNPGLLASKTIQKFEELESWISFLGCFGDCKHDLGGCSWDLIEVHPGFSPSDVQDLENVLPVHDGQGVPVLWGVADVEMGLGVLHIKVLTKYMERHIVYLIVGLHEWQQVCSYEVIHAHSCVASAGNLSHILVEAVAGAQGRIATILGLELLVVWHIGLILATVLENSTEV